MDKENHTETIIFKNDYIEKKVIHYLHGYCHLFAIVFCENYNKNCKINFCWQNETDNYYDFGFLAHAYLKLNNNTIIDCRGIINKDLIENEYITNKNLSEIFPVSTSFIRDYIKQGFLPDFEIDEYNQIKKFIEQNLSFYEQ